MGTTSTETYEGIAGGIQLVATGVAKAIGGPWWQAYATFLTGQNSWVARASDLVAKANSGQAAWTDYVELGATSVAVLGAAGFLISGSGVAAAAMSAAGVVNGLLFIWKNKGDVQNAINSITNGKLNTNNLDSETQREIDSLLKRYPKPTDPEMQREIDSLIGRYGAAKNARVDPLILDLDGDGVETTGDAGGVYFDHDGNGFAERSNWAGADDGMLVIDKNGNGTIDNGGELFGNHTRLANGQLAANGFAALADYDSDKDGDVDAGDSAYGSLKIWRDANANGKTDAGELYTLAQLGIKSLKTGYTNSSQIDANNNAHSQQGSYELENGQTRAMHDVWFNFDPTRCIETDLDGNKNITCHTVYYVHNHTKEKQAKVA